MALASEIIGDRWTMLILREAFYGVRRYDDMLADLNAPRSMLTDRLNRLVNQGIMARQPYKEPGSRTRDAYALTAAGKELALTFLALTQWGEAHLTREPAPVKAVHRQTGKPLKVILSDGSGEPVDLAMASLQKQ